MPDPTDTQTTESSSSTIAVTVGDEGLVTDTPTETKTETAVADPNLILGKFKSQEDLAKAYQELEKKLGSRTQEPAKELSGTPADLKITQPETKGGEQVLLDLRPYEKEYNELGKLSDASYQKLAKEHRIGKAQADQFIAMRVQQVQQFQQKLFNDVGGVETYQAMTQWAKANLSDQELATYDRIVDSNDPDMISLAAQGLYAKFKSAVGHEPERRLSGAAGSSGAAPFRSVHEMTAAMADPRYEYDEAYIRDIERRVAASRNL